MNVDQGDPSVDFLKSKKNIKKTWVLKLSWQYINDFKSGSSLYKDPEDKIRSINSCEKCQLYFLELSWHFLMKKRSQ
ncbi:MAG: hypothetical protein VKK42_01065 [Lyngbya sp.]|nr:hypothetical protein [Lyngbya sp.]